MTFPVDRRTVLAGMAALTLARPSIVRAATTHEVEMLNQHPEDRRNRNVFLPRIVVADPGDSILWLSVDRGHNSQSIDDMLPEGVETWRSRINDEFSITVETPGIYGYQCTPHAALGMVGLIIVRGDGMTANEEAARAVRHRGRARAAFEEIWAEVDAQGLLTS